jgi:hypothetical protein
MVFNVMNKYKMPKESVCIIVSHHTSNKSPITTCIGKYRIAYVLYDEFGIYPQFTLFKATTLPWVMVISNHLLAIKDNVSMTYFLAGEGN